MAGLVRLQREHENVIAALEWGLQSSAIADKGIELTAALVWFWVKRGLFEEGKRWLGRAVSLAPRGVLRSRALLGLAGMHYWQ